MDNAAATKTAVMAAKGKEELVFLQRAYVHNATLSLHTAILNVGRCPLCMSRRPIAALRHRNQPAGAGQRPDLHRRRRSARVARERIRAQLRGMRFRRFQRFRPC